MTETREYVFHLARPEEVEIRGLDYDANNTYEAAKAEIIASDKSHAGIS